MVYIYEENLKVSTASLFCFHKSLAYTNNYEWIHVSTTIQFNGQRWLTDILAAASQAQTQAATVDPMEEDNLHRSECFLL